MLFLSFFLSNQYNNNFCLIHSVPSGSPSRYPMGPVWNAMHEQIDIWVTMATVSITQDPGCTFSSCLMLSATQQQVAMALSAWAWANSSRGSAHTSNRICMPFSWSRCTGLIYYYWQTWHTVNYMIQFFSYKQNFPQALTTLTRPTLPTQFFSCQDLYYAIHEQNNLLHTAQCSYILCTSNVKSP